MIKGKLEHLTDQEVLSLIEARENRTSNMGNSVEGRRSLLDDEGIHEELKARMNKIVINNLLSGKTLTEKEIREVFFIYKPTALIESVTKHHAYYLELDVFQIGESGNYEKVTTHEFNKEITKIFIKDMEESRFHIGRVGETNIDAVRAMINDKVNITLEDKIISALSDTTLTVSNTNNIVQDISSAISKLSKRNKRMFTVLISPEEYCNNAAVIKNLDKINFMLVPGITNIIVAALDKLVLNYVEGKLEFDKDVKNGSYTFCVSLFNLDAIITDNNAVVKII